MAINPLLQGLVNTAKTSATVVKKNTETKAKNALGGLVTTQKETMPQARAKALLPGLVKVAETTGKVGQANVAKKQEQAKELLGGLTSTAINTAGQVKQEAFQKQDNAIGELGATVLENPNVEPSKLKQAFPEFANLPDDILGELGATVLENPNVTTEQLRKAFPELDPNYKNKSGGVALDFFEGFGSQIPQLAKKAAEKVVNPLRKLAGKRELSQEELIAQRPEQYLGVGDRNTTAGKVGGQVYNTALGTAGSIIAAPLTAGAGLLTRTAVGAGEGVVQANINSLLDRGETATATENIVGGTLGGVLGGIANVKRVKPTEKIKNLIQPKMTPTVEAERAAQGLKTTNIFGSIGSKATKQEVKMIEVAKNIGLNPSKTVTSNVNKTLSSLNKETDRLIDIVKDQPYTFTTKDVVGRMNKIEKPISLRGTDLEKQYNAVKKVFSDMIDAEPNKNASTLLKIRKDFDALIAKEYPNLYKSDTLTPLKIAITKLRKIPNEMLNDSIGDDIVKESLSKQSLMIDMIDNMAGKTEKTGTNALSRRAGRNKGKVGAAGAIGGAVLLNKLGVKIPGLSGGGGGSNYVPE